MKRLIVVISGSLLLAGASCSEPSPPSAVEVRVPVPVPCSIPEPQCPAPLYDSAKREQAGDVKLNMLRAETVQREECLRQYRVALEACRKLPD